jgi:hypothetical protein
MRIDPLVVCQNLSRESITAPIPANCRRDEVFGQDREWFLRQTGGEFKRIGCSSVFFAIELNGFPRITSGESLSQSISRSNWCPQGDTLYRYNLKVERGPIT